VVPLLIGYTQFTVLNREIITNILVTITVIFGEGKSFFKNLRKRETMTNISGESLLKAAQIPPDSLRNNFIPTRRYEECVDLIFSPLMNQANSKYALSDSCPKNVGTFITRT
jgi:hypothetical protein